MNPYLHGTLNGSIVKAASLIADIQAVVLDVDGVLNNNLEFLGFKDGSIVKSRSYYDGQGISLLRAIGLKIVLITNERDSAADHIEYVVKKWNALKSSRSDANPSGWHHVTLFTGSGGVKKLEVLKAWLQENNIELSRCAGMGDDLVDVPFLKAVSFTAAPISADYSVRNFVDFVSNRPGGNGAVRDFANFILDARGIDPLTLPPR